MKTALTLDTVAPPVGPYSHSYSIDIGNVKLIFLAGQYGTDVHGEVVGKGDMFAQTHQMLLNIQEVLHANGADFADVVKATTYLTDMSRRAEVTRARASFLPTPPPPSTLIEVPKLCDPDFLVEMEVIAVVPHAQ
ncbi:MAG: RidA family protein [Pseudomonadota bacterium]